MSTIIPGLLYLGNSDDSSNSDFLRDKNIGFILNCSKEVKNKHQVPGILEMRIPVNDMLRDEDIRQMDMYLNEAVLLLDHFLSHSKPVLVHCRQGRQRSACVVAAFLMKTYNIKYDVAIDTVKALRRDIAFLPGVNFMNSLITYGKSIQ